MKKTVAILLCVFSILLLFAGCGSTETTVAEEPTAQTDVNRQEPPDNTEQDEEKISTDSENSVAPPEVSLQQTEPTAPQVSEQPQEQVQSKLPKTEEKPQEFIVPVETVSPEKEEEKPQETPKKQDPRWADEVETPEIKAIRAVAEAYWMHNRYIQYDELMMDRTGRKSPRYEFCIPETANRQRNVHFECGVFCRNVYLTAFGYKTVKADEALDPNFDNASGIRPFYWNGQAAGALSSAEGEKKLIETIQPGDIIYYNYITNNHIMLYLGNGELIHCSYSSGEGNYDYSGYRDKTELTGLFRTDIDTYFAKKNLFAPDNKVCLWRPLATGIKPTEDTKIRAEKLSEIYINKISTAPQGISVNPGGEVEFTITLENRSKEKKVLTVTDEAPAHTKIVAETPLPWKFELAPGESESKSYKLIIDTDVANGTYISCANTKVEGMRINDVPVLVGKTLSQEQQDKIKSIDVKSITARYEKELCDKVYAELGIYNADLTAQKILPIAFSGFPGKSSTTVSPVFTENVFVPNLYGGKNCVTPENESEISPRTRGVHEYNLIPGDLILVSKDGTAETCRTYIYLGNNQAAGIDDSGAVKASVADKLLDTLFGQYCFCVVRPSWS